MIDTADSGPPNSGGADDKSAGADATDAHRPAGGQPHGRQHVSVVYFHGMGSQRRHEEVSRLIDSLDIHSNGRYLSGDTAYGRLSRIEARIEPSRIDNEGDVTFIKAEYGYRDSRSADAWTACRFYEVYWAPVMADHSSARAVLVWMFAQVLRPFATVRAPWRERQRLRRSALVELRERPERWPPDCTEDDFNTLFRAYNNFEGWDALRDYPKGRYDDFRDFLATECRSKQDRLATLRLLADRWRDAYQLSEVRNGFLLVTLALMLVLAGLLAVGLAFMVLQALSGWGLGGWLAGLGLSAIAGRIEPTLTNAIPLVIGAAALFKLTSFLTDYMGDVELWATYEETDLKFKKRKEVLKRGFAVLAHVLGDETCDRVVIVAHSLGTAVAQDTLLEVARHNLARNSQVPIRSPLALEKIRQVVTLASPVDKIQYFFESYASSHHRYKRVVEELRGDLGKPPFTKNRKPYAHWINYWDTGDIISGPIQSASNRELPRLRVDNVHVSNFVFPDPGASHSAYFDNGRVMGDLCDIIFKNAYNYANAPREEGQGYRYDALSVGPGKVFAGPRRFLFVMIAFPYVLLAAIVATAAGGGATLVGFVWMLVVAICAIVAVGYVFNKVKGVREPL